MATNSRLSRSALKEIWTRLQGISNGHKGVSFRLFRRKRGYKRRSRMKTLLSKLILGTMLVGFLTGCSGLAVTKPAWDYSRGVPASDR
jgi:hypothetical protein